MTPTPLEDMVAGSITRARQEGFHQGFRAGHGEGAEAQRRYIMEDSGANPFDDVTIRSSLSRYATRRGQGYFEEEESSDPGPVWPNFPA